MAIGVVRGEGRSAMAAINPRTEKVIKNRERKDGPEELKWDAPQWPLSIQANTFGQSSKTHIHLERTLRNSRFPTPTPKQKKRSTREEKRVE